MLKHTDKQYEGELKQLKDHIFKMGGLVEEMIAQSIRSLVERDSALAETVIQEEPQVNQLELEIDDLCMRLLALRQPAASDLRFIAISLKLSTDLERMGDLAVNIAQRTPTINMEPPLKSYVDLPKMSELVQQMVNGALDAFVNRTADEAHKICLMDDDVDRLNKKIFKDVITLMENDPKAVLRGVSLISISRHLERIADHATNIAESVIFMVQGKDIRHGGSRE